MEPQSPKEPSMLEKRTSSDQAIIHCLSANYGIDVATLTFLPWGADTNASVYKAQTPNQESYFIKLKQGHRHEIGIEIVELLHRAGIRQMIPPVKTIHNKLTHQVDDCTLIVYPFVDGQDGFTRSLTDDQWTALGKVLRQVHEVEIPSSLQNQIRQETYLAKWRDVVRAIYVYIEDKLITDEVGLKLQKFMKENMPAIRRLVERAEQLGKKLQDQSSKFVLCHSDIHAGNILLNGDHKMYILDWDEPILAPKERDLMFIGGGVGNVWNRPHEEKLFYQGYGQAEVDPTILTYYRHERIVEDIAIYSREILLTPGRSKERLEMYGHLIDQFAPRGVVEIAFETDANYTVRKK
nr:aminoglycoside phosphotransferase family protein [Simkania negevensis]